MDKAMRERANRIVEASIRAVQPDDAVARALKGVTFPGPRDYDAYLTNHYGDYMTPPPVEARNGGGHVISIIDTENDYKKYLKREE